MADDKKFPGVDPSSNDKLSNQRDGGRNDNHDLGGETDDDSSAYASNNTSTSNDAGDVTLNFFTDRDDDTSPPFVDSDYGEDFPGSDNDSETMDPGYAAFASELEDPLADWPAPDVPLNDLPEVRQQEMQRQEASQATPAAAAPPQLSPSVESEPELDLDPVMDFTEEEAPEKDMAQFDDNAEEEPGGIASKRDIVDRDESLMANSDNERFDPVEDESLPDSDAPADPEDGLTVSSHPATEDALESPEPETPLGEQAEAFSSAEEGFEEEFVDDFLNDLDPPEEELPAIEDFDDDEEFDTALPAAAAVAATTAASSVEKAAPFDSSGMSNMDAEPPEVLRTHASTPQDSEDRGFPLGMIAVVGIALLLLGIGGFGVMQQRSDLQAEIRELQAKLATTISPEEAEMEREAQRQVQLQNESLSTELEALSAENNALAAQLSELEAIKADQAAKELEREQAATKAAADAAALKRKEALAKKSAAAQSTATSGASGASVKGPWFVNFGSYADKGIADRWAKKLTVDDGKVVVQTATAAGKTLYRVRVIGLSNQDAAERIATSLERQYQLPRLWVGKN